ncbi:MAG: organic solvent tolerance protein OstA [Bacteroidetes bacterium]|nr:organic solvent tolerance protein OstA [Bacteroidota bacterium]
MNYFQKYKCTLLLLAGLILLPLFMMAQKPTRVKLIKADFARYDKRLGEDIQRLIGNVILKHDSTYLYCDSAYLYEATNSFDGFGSVRIKASDTLNIYSDLLNYKGNSRVAELHHNVRLIDRRATLYTDHLWYDRKTKIAYYTTGGKIVDSSNVLTSRKGYYYTDLKEAYFKDSVKLVNPDYVMLTDTMLYHTETEVSFFFGPTTITSDENLIYCENGWYDTRNDKSRFSRNAYMITKEQKLMGDSLYYDRKLDFGKAYNNVMLNDTVQDMLVLGDYGEFRRKAGYAFVTDSAVAVMVDKQDSLFLHADTLYIHFDSTEQIEYMKGYFKTKFYRKDMQGMCDSMIYSFTDSTIFLYKEPVLWSDENQLTADSIRIAMANNKVDTLALLGNSFIISMDDTLSRNTFNQIKGKVMTGYFRNNQLSKIMVIGNAETVYYIREEDGGLLGINVAYSSDMEIKLKDSDVITITYIKQPDAHTYPPTELPVEKRRLKNFKWLEDRRPMNQQEIFIW